MLRDTDIGLITQYTDTDIYITDTYINIGNDGTNDYLDKMLELIDLHIETLNNHLDGGSGKHDASEIDDENTYTYIDGSPTNVDSTLSYIDTELGERIDGDTGGISNTILIADGTNGKTLKAATDVIIDDNGQMSIGNSVADAMLDITCRDTNVIGLKIKAAVGQTADLLKITSSDETCLFTINYKGDTGITVCSPNEPLHIQSDYDGNRAIRMGNESAGTKAVGRFIVDVLGGSGFFAAYGSNFTTSGSKRANSASLITNASMANGLSLVARNVTGGNIRFYTGGNADANERATIRADGKFGIGTNLPDKLFEINKSTGGEIRLSYNAPTGSATDYCDLSVNSDGSLTVTTVDSDGNSGHINLDPDGNVGVNLSDPIQKFHVGGTTGNTFIALTNTFTGHTASDGIVIGLDSTNGGIFWNYENQDIVFGTNNLERMRILDDGTVNIGGDSTNYSSFASDGELTLHGTARAWKCEDLEPANVGKPTANPPADGEYQGFQFHRFDRSTEEQVYFIWHVPSDFSSGDASVRGHFGLLVENPPSGTGDEAVVMGFDYKKISPGDVFDFSSGTTSGTITITIEDGESPYKWHASDTGYCVTTGWVKDDIILFRFYRDATNANDTYDNEAAAVDNDAWVGIYHLEYLRENLGEAS